MGNARKLLVSVLAAVICVGLVGAVAVQAFGLPRSVGLQRGTFKVMFSDERGASRAAPLFDLNHASPGMVPVQTRLVIHNEGSVPATYGVSVGRITASAHSLADVLLFQVRGPKGSVVYQGDLPGLSFQAPGPLPSGATETFSIEARWPNGAERSNTYQGQSISFSFLLTAQSVSG